MRTDLGIMKECNGLTSYLKNLNDSLRNEQGMIYCDESSEFSVYTEYLHLRPSEPAVERLSKLLAALENATDRVLASGATKFAGSDPVAVRISQSHDGLHVTIQSEVS